MLSAYLDGELSEKKMRQIQEHLTKCAVCNWELKSFQKVNELGHLAEDNIMSDVPDHYWENYNFIVISKLPHNKTSKVGPFGINWFFTMLFAPDWLKRAIPVIAGIVVILLVINFVNLNHNEPMQATKTEVANTTKISSENSYTKPDDHEKIDDKIAINFYIKEHESAVIRTSYIAKPSTVGVEIDSGDMLYYNVIKRSGNEISGGEAGVFLRAPENSSKRILQEPSQRQKIANGDKITLEEAISLAGFKIVAPQTLYPGYLLESIKKIKDVNCFHLIYTNGINTLSIFEQGTNSEEKITSSDLKEYIMHSKEGDERINIISWRSNNISFYVISKEEFPQLMEIVHYIQKNQ